MRNRNTNQVRKAEGGRGTNRSSLLGSRSSRRGVLLLVVLSMLVLFMLVGTAFLMSSNQSRQSMKETAKQDRLGNNATELLNRALFQLLRDTDNPASVIRYHSLLRDLYGTDGFQAVAYSPATLDLTKLDGQATRFAGAAVGSEQGPTNGQFVDIYVAQKGFTAGDYLDYRYVLKLDRNPLNQLQVYSLPLTKGYFNGALLTITSGPASGQSARILDYEYSGELVAATATTSASRMFRFRVMTFQRADGRPLTPDQTVGSKSRNPELTELAGQTFMVNGRAFGGTGVGYNPLAAAGQPRLSAVQLLPVPFTSTNPTVFIGAELALLPNAAYFNPLTTRVGAPPLTIPGPKLVDPFITPLPAPPNGTVVATGQYRRLNDTTAVPAYFNYPTYVGSGGANEGYDAVDFQNMAQALQTVTPRSQGRVVHSNGTNPPITLDLNDPLVLNDAKSFLRLDLEDVPLPSFHRPDLVNFWYHRLLKYLSVSRNKPLTDDDVRAILQPYNSAGAPQYGLSPDEAALITSIKRQIMLRPIREDHPNFDGGNPASVPINLAGASGLIDPVSKQNITIPIWEIVGPWDVDNDNDGVRDSVWVDLGDPIQETEDGRRYKPLYAVLCVDLDSRLNVNAHGLADDIVPPAIDSARNTFFDPTYNSNPTNWVGNLAHAATTPYSTLQLPRGLGYGPAEISLRPLFPVPLDGSFKASYGNQTETASANNPVDDYATVLAGRKDASGKSVSGRYGFNVNANFLVKSQEAEGGMNYKFVKIPTSEPLTSPRQFTGEQATPDLSAQMKFFDYPWSSTQPSGFGIPPDLKGRYALGLDYAGQPNYEVARDVNPNTAALPSTQWLHFNLLANTPYELDLSGPQRRDSWASGTNSFGSMMDTATAFQTSLNQIDDSPFSPTDLEKVLRGWDADAGTLPSRLWEAVNAFDPYKLCWFDANRTASYANDLFDPTARSIGAVNPYATPSAQLLTAAQELAGISRRSVTTESFSLPVVSQTMPGYVSEFGADGAPGRRNDSAHSTLNYVNATGTEVTDDFQVITGVKRAQAKIVDLLYYRAWLEARKFVMRTQGLVESGPTKSLDSLNWADYQKFMTLVKKRTDYVFARLPSDLLAPEVLAGERMDLNRPFGNGKDDNGDGVVDDPLEAGEPFLDINGNGKMDVNSSGVALEPFIDLNGNGKYDGPGDVLWPELAPTAVGGNGTLGEQITFDYTRGHAEPVHTLVAQAIKTAMGGAVIQGGVRNLESQGRQVFARHLYCLMLLLVDENYIAPWDEKDPQLATFMEAERNKLISTALKSPLTTQEADLVVKRKLTCKMIAQWAVNCVDMRDPDVIMTPFEYDENPWDGWGVWDDNWAGDLTSLPNFTNGAFDPTKATFIPLDGDPATNENDAWVIDWSVSLPPSGGPKTIKQLAVNPSSPVSASNPPIITQPLNQTRGVVWGAERPELLITETLAYHDRRTEDLSSPSSHFEMQHYDEGPPPNGYYADPDPDQGLRPRGALMVEVQNPWSPDGQYPAEIYSRINSSLLPTDPNWLTKSQGVELGRLSNYAWDEAKSRLTLDKTDAANGIKRSPVWKLAIVEEWFDSRNDDDIDDKRLDRELQVSPAFKEPKAYTDMAAKVKAWTPSPAEPNPPFRPTDIDFDAAFDAGFLPKQKAVGLNMFEMKYPYVEREFYFTTDKSPEVKTFKPSDLERIVDYDYSPASFKLRIPFRGIQLQYPTNTGLNPKVVSTQRFIPWGLELSSSTQPAIAPIMPGRCGVIGSAGANYYLTSIAHDQEKDPAKQIYISTTGRKDTGNFNTDDKDHYPLETRRIEMRPSNDPTVQQLIIGSNGGDPKDEYQPDLGSKQYDPTTQEIGRDNELINNRGTVDNITTPDVNGKPKYYQSCVAIPVAGMNISEPAWGYSLNEAESAVTEATIKSQKLGVANKPTILTFMKNPTLTDKNYEGRYYATSTSSSPISYDKPFDGYPGHKTAPELLRNGTTANYRTIHLQRLANPMLPWNPMPGTFKDSAGAEMYRANMPINPYRTVDTSSVNLTAFNGVSEAETTYPASVLPGAQADLLQKRPWNVTDMGEMISPQGSFTSGKQVWYFRSTERGAWSRLNVLGSNPTAPATATSPPQRVLWAQEPAMVRFKKPQPIGAVGSVYDLIPDRQVTMRVDEVPSTIKATTAQNIKKNRVEMVMENTLGFGNKSFGLLYDKVGAKQPGTPIAASTSTSSAPSVGGVPLASAVGAPAPGDFTWDNNGDKAATDPAVKLVRIPVNSTNPWLAWDNRPYVSAEELLKVPAASQSQMLRMTTAIDPNVAAASRANPYGLAGLGSKANTTPVPNAIRAAFMQSPFGDLANMFSASGEAADVVRDPATGIPVVDTNGNVQPFGAPNFYRILEYVQVPSRFVGTDTMLNAETFNDAAKSATYPTEPVGSDIADLSDPRLLFQPPFNKVSRQRDPGRVNLNTVTGRRVAPSTSTAAAMIWSEVYDGIMHRFHDGNLPTEIGHFGPAWRDVALSRRGYVQIDAAGGTVDKPNQFPDTFEMGLNNNFPTVFSNPFRSPDAGDLVPLVQMMQFGVDASMERVHPRNRGYNTDAAGNATYDPIWGSATGYTPFNDARDAGFGNDGVSFRTNNFAIPETAISQDPKVSTQRDTVPLFSEARDQSFADTNRNPYMMYEPMSRLGNLVTNRSGVFAVWITVGYFEVEKAPDWNDPNATTQTNVRAHFGNDINLYNRAYPDGYMLGKELGSETGDVKRPRGFYIIDRTEEVGFKPGEDLNVEKTIRLRRRIE